MYDWAALRPFQVLRIPYEFDGDPDRVLKLWVVVRNFPEHKIVACFKPTSQTDTFDRERSLLQGVVEYEDSELKFLPKGSLKGPKRYSISYTQLDSCMNSETVQPLGELPNDFREKIRTAANNKTDWRKANREEFFGWFDVSA